MTLRSLHLENYKQYGRLDLEFRDGLVGIIGRNGAGKSTLFEAVLYCLYGKDESNKNLIRSAFADPRSTVVLELRFAVGPAEYLVRREFRGKAMAVNAELYKNDGLVAKGAAPVNDEVARILNMERDAFKRSVFSGQSELSELSKTKGEERKRMVRKMLGLDTLDEVQADMNADARELNSQITGQQQNLLDAETIRTLQTGIAAQTKQLGAAGKTLEKEQKKLRAVEAGHQAARKKFAEEEEKSQKHHALQQETGRLHERLDGLQAQRQTLLQKIGNLEAQGQKLAAQQPEMTAYERDQKQFRQLENARQNYINRIANLQQLAELEPGLLQTRQRIAGLDALLEKRPATEAALLEKLSLAENLDKAVERQREIFNELKSRQDTLAAQAEERRNKIRDLERIGREGTCPTCFQPVLEAYEQVLAQLNRELENLQNGEISGLEAQKEAVRQEGLQLRTRLDETRRALETLQAERTRLQELAKQKSHEEMVLKNLEAQLARIQHVLREIGEVAFDEKTYARLKNNLDGAAPRYQQFANDSAYLAREEPATRAALRQTETAIADTEKQLRERQAELAQTGYEQARYDEARQALTQFADAYTAQSDQVRALEKTTLELQNSIAQRREKLRADEQIRTQISAKLADVDTLRKLGELLLQFKTEILEKVSPSISQEASELFSRITKGKYERIQVDENFDFFIADGGILYPIERFSGGEIDLANFCLRIAVTKAIMQLSGNSQGVEFLAFDEIFGSQDEERRHEMMLALYYLQEQFRQIYIVSHIDSQKDYFPNLLEVRFRPEGSVATWVG